MFSEVYIYNFKYQYDKNPKKLRQNLKKSFETSLAKDISNIIGTP